MSREQDFIPSRRGERGLSEDELESPASQLLEGAKLILNRNPNFIKAVLDHYWGKTERSPASRERTIEKGGTYYDITFRYDKDLNYQALDIIKLDNGGNQERVSVMARFKPEGVTKGYVSYSKVPSKAEEPSLSFKNTKSSIRRVEAFLKEMEELFSKE